MIGRIVEIVLRIALEALAELDVGPGNDLLELGVATGQPALMCQASSVTFLKRRVQLCPRRVKILTASFANWICTR